MVGSMLAAAVAPLGLKVVVLENQLPAAFDHDSPYDLRVSALSIASENMLTAVGALSSRIVSSSLLCIKPLKIPLLFPYALQCR